MGKITKNKLYHPLLWLIFLVVTLLVYNKTLGNYFVSDDWHWLYLAKHTGLTWHIFWSNYEGGNLGGSYNPLLILIWKLFFSIFELKYSAYHFISLVLHASNAFILYLLAKKVFALLKINSINIWSLITAAIFLLWPVQVEAISWLAAWPHLWVTMFYLLSLWFYFSWRQYSQQKHIYTSLIFFVLALLTKEVAISLPFVILLWEAYFYSAKARVNTKELPIYFVILAIFMFVRYQATAVLFGYYGRTSFTWPIKEWLGNLGGFLNDFLSAGYLREIYFKAWYHYLDSVVMILAIALAIYFYYLLKRQGFSQFTIFFAMLLSMVPALPLGLNRTTFEGERYLYLPSIFFALWFVYILAKIRLAIKLKYVLLIVLLLSSLSIIYNKNNIWRAGADLSKQAVVSFDRLGLPAGQKLMTVALPDNLSGAQVFRNNLQQALEFTYPDKAPQILALPVYQRFNMPNANDRLLNWQPKEGGWLAQSADGNFVVTGITSIEVDSMYFELWNYNYQNYTSNIIRLIPKDTLVNQLSSQDIKLLIFDRGVLKLFK
jgi:protein O-mannosyl-transferase